MRTLIVPGLNGSGPDHLQTWIGEGGGEGHGQSRCPGCGRPRQPTWTGTPHGQTPRGKDRDRKEAVSRVMYVRGDGAAI